LKLETGVRIEIRLPAKSIGVRIEIRTPIFIPSKEGDISRPK
jgi:hypothetical protein